MKPLKQLYLIIIPSKLMRAFANGIYGKEPFLSEESDTDIYRVYTPPTEQPSPALRCA